MDEFEKLGIEEGDTFRMQPCLSPVWDTAYALLRWAGGGSGDGSAAGEVRRLDVAETGAQAGDWKIKNPKGEPGGWYFEFNNEF